MTVLKSDVTFRSGDEECAGWLFLPDGEHEAPPHPGVVMAHGIGAVKEMSIEPFAERFAEAGFATLLFDFRYFGASGGEPRGQLFPHEQHEDFRNALTWLGLRDDVDDQRLGLWGTSFSGGHVLQVTAGDARVKAVVSQVAAVDTWSNLQRITPPRQLAFMQQTLVEDRRHRYLTGERRTIPLTAPAGELSVLGDADYDRHMEWQRVAPNWRNALTLESLEWILEYNPGAYTPRISPTPLMMVIAAHDELTPADLALAAFEAAHEPKRLLLLRTGHYAVYEHPETTAYVADAATRFLTEHLGTSQPAATFT